MNHRLYATAFALAFFVTGMFNTKAQSNFSKWQLGVNGGILVYQGDLTPEPMGSYRTSQSSLGIYVSRVLNPSLLLRTNLAVGRLHGTDIKYNKPAWRQERNLAFTSPVFEISELLVWNMLGNNNNELRSRFSPYAFAGVGINILNINRDTSGFNTHYFSSATNIMNGLNADLRQAPPRSTFVIPMGLGVEYYLSPKLSLTAETNFRYTFTDYLDGFSLSANPENNDFYHSHSIGLLWRFGGSSKLDCPVLKR